MEEEKYPAISDTIKNAASSSQNKTREAFNRALQNSVPSVSDLGSAFTDISNDWAITIDNLKQLPEIEFVPVENKRDDQLFEFLEQIIGTQQLELEEAKKSNEKAERQSSLSLKVAIAALVVTALTLVDAIISHFI